MKSTQKVNGTTSAAQGLLYGPIASLLGVIFHVLLRKMSVILNAVAIN